jgi:hypothetical protein
MGGNVTDIRCRSQEEIIASLSRGIPDEIRDALISASYWDKDWKWALRQLRKFAEHRDDVVLWAVATGVGFIAAFNGEIDEHEAQSILTRLKENPNSAVAAAATEAEADIEHFVGHRQRGEDIELVERLSEDWLSLPREVFLAKPHTDPRNSEPGCQCPVSPRHGNPVGLIAAMVLLFPGCILGLLTLGKLGI